MAERRRFEDPEPEEELDYETATGISFMERWTLAQKQRKIKGSLGGKKRKIFMRCIFLFQIPTEVYVFLVYIIPHLMQDYDPMTIYCAKVLAFFIGLNMTVNLFSVILYDPAFRKTKDQPLLPIVNNNGDGSNEYFVGKIQDATSNGKGDHLVFNMADSESEEQRWHFCEKCAMHVPFRVHHCNDCKTCVTKRDHHCYIIGNCVGYNNQRYFLVLTFYVAIAGLFGAYFTGKYLHQVAWDDVYWYDYIFPVMLFRWKYGVLPGLYCLLIVHIYIELILGLVCFGFHFTQLQIILQGITLYEYRKSVPVRTTTTRQQNLHSVFGDFWFLNFLFPMTPIFRQKGDGTIWEGVHINDSKGGSKVS